MDSERIMTGSRGAAIVRSVLLVLASLLLSAQVQATGMAVIDDSTLSEITGADGIEVELKNPTAGANVATITQMKWVTDATLALGCTAGGVANKQACSLFNNVAISGGTAAAPIPFYFSSRVDVGDKQQAAAAGTLGTTINLNWNKLQLAIGGATIQTPTNIAYGSTPNSFGSTAIQTQGSLLLFSQNGLLKGTGNSSYFNLTSSGDIFFRQGVALGTAEMSFGNFSIGGRFTNGAALGQGLGYGNFGINNSELVLSAPFAVLDLFFDLMFKATPTVAYDTVGRGAMILFGWQGGLVNFDTRIKSGGLGYGTYIPVAGVNHATGGYTYFDTDGTGGPSAVSECVRVAAEWDFDTDFAWLLGQAGGNRTQLRFFDWKRMGAAPGKMLRMPMVLDIVQNGVGPNNGLGNICWGGGFTGGMPIAASCTAAGGTAISTGPTAGESAVAVYIRDAWVHAYNTKVEIKDPVAPYTNTFNWSLIYTFGKLDADIFLSPEGPAAATTGVRSDVTLTIQSPGFWRDATSAVAATRNAAGANWQTNTHFMLADTGITTGAGCSVPSPCTYAVGIINADLLWNARDLYIRVMKDGTTTAYPTLPGGLWLQAAGGVRYEFRGIFGGGNVANLTRSTLSQMALLDVNLETSNFLFVLSPGTVSGGDAPIAFNGLLDFNGAAYMTIAEVSSPSSSFRVTNVIGRLGWENGSLLVQSGQTTPNNLPQLVISNDLVFGDTAKFGAVTGGAPFVGNIGFGGETFGSIAIPAGRWNSSVTLKIP